MNDRANMQKDLLEYIKSVKTNRRKEDISTFEKELATYKEAKREAYTRMQAQKRAGNLLDAKRSEKAYNYCCKYVSQLEHILDGYKHQGKVILTKDGHNRYRTKPKEV